MPKKHRVKRAKYVEHLLKVEREREAFLDHRLKRSRQSRNEEDPMAEAREAMESAARAKKRRTEDDESEEGGTEASSPANHAAGRGTVAMSKQEHEEEAEVKREAAHAQAAADVTAVATAGFFKGAKPFPTSEDVAGSAAKMAPDTDSTTAATKRKTVKKRY